MIAAPPPPRLPFRHFWLWLALVVLAFLLSRPVIHGVKEWRSDVFARRGESALRKGEWEDAREQALLSLQLQPSRLDALRVLARAVAERDEGESLKIRAMILDQPAATDDDRLALAEAALDLHGTEIVSRQLQVLLERPVPTRETYRLAGMLAAHENQPAVAREWLLQALARDPAYAPAEVELARVELWMIREGGAEERALERLQRLATRTNEVGLQAWRLIAQWATAHVSRLPWDDAWTAKITAHPGASLADHCLAAEWQYATDPARAPEIVERLLAVAKKHPLARRQEVGAWLNRHRMYEKTLAVFPLDPEGPDHVVLAQLDALAGLGRWAEVRDFLSRNILEAEPVLQALYRARAERELGHRLSFEWGWRQAMRAAAGNPRALQYLLAYAERLGEPALAVDAGEALYRQPGFQQPALLRLVPLYEKLGRTRDLLGVMNRLLALRPDDVVVLNDAAWLSLLLKDSVDVAQERANFVYRTNPKLPAFTATYALAKLRRDQADQALKALEGIPRASLTAPGWQAVLAATLAANGKTREAATVAAGIRQDLLKPEEKSLLTDAGLPAK